MQFFAAFLAGVTLFFTARFFPFATVFVTLSSCSLLLRRKKFLGIVVLSCGAAFAFFRYEPVMEVPHIRDNILASGIFRSYPVRNKAGAFTQTFIATSAVNAATGEGIQDLAGREITIFSGRAFDPGTECDLRISLLKSRDRLNPGERTGTGIYANLLDVSRIGRERAPLSSGIERCRYRISRYLEDNMSGESGALVTAITVGQQARLGDELREAFGAAGLAHILSISGTHFGLFSFFLFGVFRVLLKLLPYGLFQRMTLCFTPSQVAALLSLPFTLAYLAISGASVPAVRSFVMISLFLLGLIIGRRGYWVTSVLFAACIIVAWDPGSILSLSLQLSFLAVLLIGLALRTGGQEERESGRILNYIKKASLMTLAASVGTAPLVAYYFHYFSLISPVSNLLLAPLIGFALIPLSIVSCFLFLITGHFVFTPFISLLSGLSIASVKALSGIPFASIGVPAFPPVLLVLFYCGLLVCLLAYGRLRKGDTQHEAEKTPRQQNGGLRSPAVSLQLADGKRTDETSSRRNHFIGYLFIAPFLPFAIYSLLQVFDKNALSVTFLDVGQGDSSVVELPDGKTMVIDTGRTGRETASFLKYRGKKRVDVIVLSHVHPDHTGGLYSLMGKFSVGEIWDNGRMVFSNGLDTRSLNRGDVIEGKGYRISVLHPYPRFYTLERTGYLSANNDSLVFKVEAEGLSMLFTGDIDEEAEKDILHLGKWIRADIVKIPHHGGRTSAYGPFLAEVAPEIAVISAGRENEFGHPHRETLDVLHGSKVLRTDLDGAVEIRSSGEGPEIKTYDGFRVKEARSLSDEAKNMRRLFDKW